MRPTPPRPARSATAPALALLLLAWVAPAPAQEIPAQPPPDEPTIVYAVEDDEGVASLPARAEAQAAAAAELDVPLGFRFTDRQPESGIDWRHRIVDDAGIDYKAVHYDHGNAVAPADVDGDGLTDLYFTTQVGANALYRNRGDGTFEEITEEAGVALPLEISVAASFADTDNDGDPDLYVTTVLDGNHLYENLGEGRFREITDEAGVGHQGHSSGAMFFDYDRDGRLDLLLTNVGVYTSGRRGRYGYRVGVEDAFSGHLFPKRTETSILYRNLGENRFEDVTEEVGLVDGGWSGDAAFADLDRDGWDDVYLPNMQGDDHFWRNQAGKRFVEVTERHFPKTPWGTMGIGFLDFDQDGLPDLVLTDMHSDMSQDVGPDKERVKAEMLWPEDHLQGSENNLFGNALYHNRGEGRFEERSDELGVETYWPWGLTVADVNADGWPDVFVTNSMNYPFRYQPNSLLVNDRGRRFVDLAFPLGIEPRRDGRTHQPWFELHCDGRDAGRIFCREKREEGETGTFVMMGTLGSRSSAIFDLEGDGDLDIVTNEFNDVPQVLVSDLSQKGAQKGAQQGPVRWVGIELEGRHSNRDGLGARVEVTAGGRTWHRLADGKTGYLAHGSVPLYFGLGGAERVERVVVEWPSGVRQVVAGEGEGEGLAVGEVHRVVEPAAERDVEAGAPG